MTRKPSRTASKLVSTPSGVHTAPISRLVAVQIAAAKLLEGSCLLEVRVVISIAFALLNRLGNRGGALGYVKPPPREATTGPAGRATASGVRRAKAALSSG
jgi:hypothetical protein